MVGGHVSHYLLEKSRICSQAAEERGYHVFYRMLAGAPREMKKALGLEGNTQFSVSGFFDSMWRNTQVYNVIVRRLKVTALAGFNRQCRREEKVMSAQSTVWCV